MEATIKERLRPVPEDGDGGTGGWIYHVPAVRGEGEEILREMAANLAALIGERETMTLLSRMDLSKRYSLFGMNDTRIEITPRNEGGRRPEEAFAVRIVQTDPETNAVVGTCLCSFGGLKQSYGNVFEMPRNE